MQTSIPVNMVFSWLRLTFTLANPTRRPVQRLLHSIAMKYILLPLIATFLLTSGSLYAQAPSNSGLQQVEDPALQEMRVVAGSLKELHGELNDQLTAVTKLSGTTDRIAAKRFVEIEGEIKEDITKVEGGLDRMSGMAPSAWVDARDGFMELQQSLKASTVARTKGLKEAYGEK